MFSTGWLIVNLASKNRKFKNWKIHQKNIKNIFFIANRPFRIDLDRSRGSKHRFLIIFKDFWSIFFHNFLLQVRYLARSIKFDCAGGLPPPATSRIESLRSVWEISKIEFEKTCKKYMKNTFSSLNDLSTIHFGHF